MRNILLAAKFEAMKAGADAIALAHVQEALKGIAFSDAKAQEKVYAAFDVSGLTPTAVYTQADLEKAAEHPKVSYEGALKTKLQALKEEGISASSEAVTQLASAAETSPSAPKRALSGFEQLNAIKALKQTLQSKLYNQDAAIEAVCDAMVKTMHHPAKNRPQGIFFFLGPPATGKTYLAQLLQEHVEGYGEGMIFDMTQFTSEEGGGALYGTSRMWGNTRTGALTSFVRENPKSIIVLDEFEKAHSKVQGNLLTILSSGYLTDVCGWCKKNGKPYGEDNKCKESDIEDKVDFSQTIIIFTSNLGKEIYNNRELMSQFSDDPETIERMVYDVINRETKKEQGSMVPAITPEMLSRLKQGSMVLFNRLNYANMLRIAKNSFEEERIAFEKNYGIEFGFSDELMPPLLLSFGPEFDVREVKSKIGKAVFDTVTDFYMKHDVEIKAVDIYVPGDVDDEDEDLRMLKEVVAEEEGLLQRLQRKSRRLSYELDVEYVAEGQTLVISLKNYAMTQVKQAKDLSSGGVAIEMPDVTFADIAGHHKVKTRLKEVVHLLSDYKTLQSLGTQLSKGMLMYGPPGTGKTMLAKALAREAGLPFISTTGQEILQEEKMHQVFSTAREYAPSIIFIDEIDAIRARGESAHNNSYFDGKVNSLLTQIDGFGTSLEEPVFIIAATNRMEGIDPAILRSGRIDIHVHVSFLDYDARAYFIDAMMKKPIFSSEIDRDRLIRLSAGLSGADLKKVERESILYAYRNAQEKVTQEVVLEQINIIKHGNRIENRDLSAALEATAYHEAGHAVLSKLLIPHKKIEQVTVMPRDKSLGFVSFSGEGGEYYSQNVDYFKNEMRVSIAGRAAQIQKYGHSGIDAGASADLKHATKLAYIAIAELGMDEALTNVSFSAFHGPDEQFMSDTIQERIAVWMREETAATQALVKEHWASIENVAKSLIEDEQIDEKTLISLMRTDDT